MPNWCFNHVEVTAPNLQRMQEFIDFCSKPHIALWDGEKEETGVFWNFASPTDLNTYFGISAEEHPYEKSDDIMTNVLNSLTYDNDSYSWNVRNWGTKWDIDPVFDNIQEISDGTAFLNWNFDTAWSPPLEIYSLMAETFPDFEFEIEYFEPGLDFAGGLTLKNGEIETELHIQSPTHEDYLTKLGFTNCEICGTSGEICTFCSECFENKPCECEESNELVTTSVHGDGGDLS